MKIKLVVFIYWSQTDQSGNRYWAAQYVRTSDGAVASVRIGSGQGGAEYAAKKLIGNWENILTTSKPMGIREFNIFVRDFPHLDERNDNKQSSKQIRALWRAYNRGE